MLLKYSRYKRPNPAYARDGKASGYNSWAVKLF